MVPREQVSQFLCLKQSFRAQCSCREEIYHSSIRHGVSKLGCGREEFVKQPSILFHNSTLAWIVVDFLDLDLLKVRGYPFTLHLMNFIKKDVGNINELYSSKGFLFLDDLVLPLFNNIQMRFSYSFPLCPVPSHFIFCSFSCDRDEVKEGNLVW